MSDSLYSDDNQRLCAILRRERTRAGLQQKELAERISRNQSFVTRYETGQKTLDVHELLEICRALSYDPRLVIGELLAWQPDNETAK
ncbi:MAG: helix-turn-helix domain-containing protein [Gammaproteobacteria bacterium]|nr:helix-turn-helix domain-containing protein [Gammaproteobacteria bacterium]